ncbi:putative O-glycosylation ligase, exosortase A system-associated [Dyella sp. A6]|uniref:putative O-glycosylation ligase, exosortase A system-associated n=1 Tax=Dyella aluminiiresistens TaxID=3069105 RepID=UPI002E7A6D3F|nr:putative O-glycosylation ligase, exosortase A system-associated [Dyella sp. A6]
MRDIALAMFIFGMIPFILMRPFIGLLVWSWLGYMNPNRLCFGFAVNFPWVQLVAIVTLVSLFISREKKKVPVSSTSVLLLLFLAWTGITTYFAVVPAAALSKWEEFAKILVMVFVTFMLVNTRERMRWLVWMIVVSIGFYGLKGGVFTIAHGGSYHVVGPAKSFIADNNALALALCISVPLMRFLQLHSPSKYIRWGLSASILLTCISVLGTYSRGGLISLTIVAGALFLKSRRRLAMVVAAIVVGMVGYHFMPQKWTERMDTLHHASHTDSGETRIQSYEFAANVALHHPVLGGGFFVYESNAMWQRYGPEGAIPRAVHSIYFRVLGEQGFVGLSLFLSLLYVSWKNCRVTRKRTRDVPELKWAYDLSSMLQVSLLAFMTAGAFLPMSYFDLAYQLMALCALLLFHVQQLLDQHPDGLDPGQSREGFGLPTTRRILAG